MRNFLITMAIMGGMILAVNLILKDYIYYRRVKKDHDIESSERYLRAFPGGFFADEVEKEYDEYSYQRAEKEGTVESYDEYLKKFGQNGRYEGKHIEEATAQYEALTFQQIREREDLEEVIRFLKRFPESRYESELKVLETELWKQNQAAFNAYARANNYGAKLTEVGNQIFDYMRENRFTRLYIGATLDKESLKDWNDYPSEVRLLWDDSTRLATTFDQQMIVAEQDTTSLNQILFPYRMDVPSESPPASIKGFIRRDRVRKVFSDAPRQIKEELQKSMLNFPILHTVRNPDEIPHDAPAIVLTCFPATKEISLSNKKSPVFSMMLKERRNRGNNVQFNGYMLGMNVGWSLAFLEGENQRKEIYGNSFSPDFSTQFLSRNDLSKQYSQMIDETYGQFSSELAKKSVFKLNQDK